MARPAAVLLGSCAAAASLFCCSSAHDAPADVPPPLVPGSAGHAPGPPAYTAPPLQLVVADLNPVAMTLFREEREAIRREVARRVEALGAGRWSVLPVEVHDRALTAGPGCAEPHIHPASSLQRSFSEVGIVHVAASCTPACALRVNVEGAPTGQASGARRATLAGFTSPDRVAHGATMPDWLAAAASLTAEPPAPAEGGLLLGGLASAPPDPARVHFSTVHATGPWSSSPADAAFAPARSSLDACWSPPRLGGDRVPVVQLAVDEAGRPSRCEAGRLEEQSDPFLACTCAALSRATFGAGAAGRRLQLHVSRSFTPRRLIEGRPLFVRVLEARASDGIHLGPRLPDDALSACITRAPAGGRATLSVAWVVDAAGLPTSVDARPPPGGTAPGASAAELLADATTRECVVDELLEARFGCPIRGAPLTVQATIEVALGRASGRDAAR